MAKTQGVVAVAENEAIEPLAAESPENPGRQAIRSAPAVDQPYPESADLDDLAVGYAANGRVHVAAHRMKFAVGKCHQNVRIDHIACMQDDFRIGKMALRQGA